MPKRFIIVCALFCVVFYFLTVDLLNLDNDKSLLRRSFQHLICFNEDNCYWTIPPKPDTCIPDCEKAKILCENDPNCLSNADSFDHCYNLQMRACLEANNVCLGKCKKK